MNHFIPMLLLQTKMTLKLYKPEKNYPMRAAVATIRSNITFTVIEKKWHLEIFSKNNTAQLKQKQTQSF